MVLQSHALLFSMVYVQGNCFNLWKHPCMSPPSEENGEPHQQGICFLPVDSCFLLRSVSMMPGKAGTELPSTTSSPLILVWESKSHRGLAVSFSVPILKYVGHKLWQHLHQQATPFQFPTRINQISYKLRKLLEKRLMRQQLILQSMSNILNTLTVTKAERQTLNHSVKKEGKQKRTATPFSVILKS